MSASAQGDQHPSDSRAEAEEIVSQTSPSAEYDKKLDEEIAQLIADLRVYMRK